MNSFQFGAIFYMIAALVLAIVRWIRPRYVHWMVVWAFFCVALAFGVVFALLKIT